MHLKNPRHKKCPNCNGTGKVNGGFTKRIKRDIEALEDQRELEITKEIAKIKEKNKSRKLQKEREIRTIIGDRYEKLIKTKDKETPKIISSCYRCEGRGYR